MSGTGTRFTERIIDISFQHTCVTSSGQTLPNRGSLSIHISMVTLFSMKTAIYQYILATRPYSVSSVNNNLYECPVSRLLLALVRICPVNDIVIDVKVFIHEDGIYVITNAYIQIIHYDMFVYSDTELNLMVKSLNLFTSILYSVQSQL